MKKSFFIFLFNIFLISAAFATHMRAGYITYEWVSGLTYKFTVVTYTNTLSPADRPSYTIDWGDGTTSVINRYYKGPIGPASDEVSINLYDTTAHTFPGPYTYVISLTDPNRNAGIINIPNSVNVPFYVQTVLVINPFLGPSNSPQILNPPIENGCLYEPFIYNPGAYNTNGDSLSYSMIECKTTGGLDIAGYSYPAYSHSFGINAVTGDLVWNSPELQGEYNVAILIKEWRYGQLICQFTIDMQITIIACNDHPPVIDPIRDTCVLEGTLLKFDVHAHCDIGETVTLSASGEPMIVSIDPAVFNTVSHLDTVSSLFSWQTICNDVRKQPYEMTFIATDDASPVNLTAIQSMMITVVAPAPPNLVATPMGNNINLVWDESPCTNAIGYQIYRRNGFYGYIHGPCQTGVPAYTGYVQIATVSGVNDTTFTDNNDGNGLIHGIDYCYMVVAYFSDGAESYASNEACTTLIKDVPIITNVSVINTDALNGSIYVAWSKPSALDTTVTTGPYKYLIYHSNDFTGSHLTLIDSLSELNDTTFIDSPINTVATPWSYRIDLWNETPGNRFLIGTTQKASSVFLTFSNPANNELQLNFTPNVPWVNDTFVVYRKNNITLNFDSIGYSLTTKYIDAGLKDSATYCYKVKSIGSYFAPGLINPIINFSQINCGIALDNIPPCPPNLLSVVPDCDNITNTLTWNDPNHTCANDVVAYHIYYTPVENGDYTLIATINNAMDTTYIHQGMNSIAGCYVVTALDSFHNESTYSNAICVDINGCNLYHLPNVFTPNGDSWNSVFSPFLPYDFVQKVNMTIFNRWGKIVFTTEDPNINWDGKDKYTHMDCSDGVYFYVCDVYEYRLAGIRKRTLTGCVQLLR
ncbi:MAG: gliding motility-associated C-terminal domain-containing protein [Bacteroidales bacterium]|jgi:gliding motility-associated-like protein